LIVVIYLKTYVAFISKEMVQCKRCFIPSRLNTTEEQLNADSGLTLCVLEREITHFMWV